MNSERITKILQVKLQINCLEGIMDDLMSKYEDMVEGCDHKDEDGPTIQVTEQDMYCSICGATLIDYLQKAS